MTKHRRRVLASDGVTTSFADLSADALRVGLLRDVFLQAPQAVAPQRGVRWAFVALFTVAYALAAGCVLWIYAQRGDTPVVYFAAGILWAALLLSNRREWVAIAALALIIQWAFEVWLYSSPLTLGLIFAVSKVLEAVLCVASVQFLSGRAQQRQVIARSLRFVLFAGLVFPALFAIPPTLARELLLYGSFVFDWREWASWTLVQGAGNVLVAPAVIALWLLSTGRVKLTARFAEAGSLAVVLLGTSVALFLFNAFSQPVSIYLITPALFWAAVRFGTVGSAVASFAIAVVATAGQLTQSVYFLPLASAQDLGASLCLYLLINAASSLVIGGSADDKRFQLVDLVRARRQLRELAVTANRNEDAFRSETAELIHDSMGQILALGRIRADLLDARLGADSPHSQTLNDIKDSFQQAITISRSITAGVSSTVFQGGDFGVALQKLLDALVAELDMETRLKVNLSVNPDTAIASSLFRCTRELLVNVVKHSQASLVCVDVERSDRSLQIVVTDNGAGFDADEILARQERGGYGLFSCQNTLESMGGGLSVASRIGHGTRATLEIPLAEGLLR